MLPRARPRETIICALRRCRRVPPGVPVKIVSNLIWWVSPRGLRHRIVVPVFVGSNPITHPIKKRAAHAALFFIWVFVGDGIRRGRHRRRAAGYGRGGDVALWSVLPALVSEGPEGKKESVRITKSPKKRDAVSGKRNIK